MTDSRTDEGLMSAYRHGDAAAFDVLYARHRAPLFRYVLRQCARREQADELFQEVWMSVIRARSSYEPRAKFTTWLYRIAANRLIDHYRASGRLSLHEGAIAEDEDGALQEFADVPENRPEAIVDRQRLGEHIVAAVDALPLLQREAFVLAVDAGLSVEQIAEVTGVGFETSKSRLRYAHHRLRQLLEDLRP